MPTESLLCWPVSDKNPLGSPTGRAPDPRLVGCPPAFEIDKAAKGNDAGPVSLLEELENSRDQIFCGSRADGIESQAGTDGLPASTGWSTIWLRLCPDVGERLESDTSLGERTSQGGMHLTCTTGGVCSCQNALWGKVR